jgi:2-polyprenyl-6-methoxyphenol hydroxylase-like FAD-dependent oxidoreductase
MPSRTQSGFDVLIIGASICGLTTATALAQKGHRVRVLEGEGALNELGASLTILPSATRLLVSWGLEDELKKYGTRIRCFTSRDGVTGEVIGHTPCNIGNTAQISFDGEYAASVVRVWWIRLTPCIGGGISVGRTT